MNLNTITIRSIKYGTTRVNAMLRWQNVDNYDLSVDGLSVIVNNNNDKEIKKQLQGYKKVLVYALVCSLCFTMNDTTELDSRDQLVSLNLCLSNLVNDNYIELFKDIVMTSVDDELSRSSCEMRLACGDSIDPRSSGRHCIHYYVLMKDEIKFVYHRLNKHKCVLVRAPSIRSHSSNAPMHMVSDWCDRFALCDYNWNEEIVRGSDAIVVKYHDTCPFMLTQENDVVEYKEEYRAQLVTDYFGKLVRSGCKSMMVFGIEDKTLKQKGCSFKDDDLQSDLDVVVQDHIKGYFPPLSLTCVSVDVWDVPLVDEDAAIDTSDDNVTKRCIAISFDLPLDYQYLGLNITARDVEFLSPQLAYKPAVSSQLHPVAVCGTPLDLYFKVRAHLNTRAEDLLVSSLYAKLFVNHNANECSVSLIERILPFVHFDGICSSLDLTINVTLDHSPLLVVWCVAADVTLSRVVSEWRKNNVIKSTTVPIQVIVLTNTGAAELWSHLDIIKSIENVELVDVISSTFPPTWRNEYPAAPIVQGGTLINHSHTSDFLHVVPSLRISYLEKCSSVEMCSGISTATSIVCPSLLDLVHLDVPFRFKQIVDFENMIWSKISENKRCCRFSIIAKQASIGASTALRQIGVWLSRRDSRRVCVCMAGSCDMTVNNCENMTVVVLCDKGIKMDTGLFDQVKLKYKQLAVISVSDSTINRKDSCYVELDPFLRSNDEASKFVEYLKTCYTDEDSGHALDILYSRFCDKSNDNIYDKHRFAFVITATKKLTEPVTKWIDSEFRNEFNERNQCTLRQIAFLQYFTKNYHTFLGVIDSSLLAVKRGGLLMRVEATGVMIWDPLIAECICKISSDIDRHNNLLTTWESLLRICTLGLGAARYSAFLHDTLSACDCSFSLLVKQVLEFYAYDAAHHGVAMTDELLVTFVDNWFKIDKLRLCTPELAETAVHIEVLRSRLYRELTREVLCLEYSTNAVAAADKLVNSSTLPIALSNCAFNYSYFEKCSEAHKFYLRLLEIAPSGENKNSAVLNAKKLPKHLEKNAITEVTAAMASRATTAPSRF